MEVDTAFSELSEGELELLHVQAVYTSVNGATPRKREAAQMMVRAIQAEIVRRGYGVTTA